MRNQVGGPNRKPRRGGPAGFLARRMGLWSSPPSQYCNNDPAISFQKFQGERSATHVKGRRCVADLGSLPLWIPADAACQLAALRLTPFRKATVDSFLSAAFSSLRLVVNSRTISSRPSSSAHAIKVPYRAIS